MNTLIKNAAVLTMRAAGEVVYGDIGISGDTIKFVGFNSEFMADNIIDAAGMLAIPGLVNAHTHAPMVLMRNYGNELNLQDWLNHKIFPAEDKLTREHVYYATQVAAAEMLLSGTTLFCDMYNFEDAIAEVVAECGIKASLSRGIMCFDDKEDYGGDHRLAEGIRLYDDYDGYLGRIKVRLAPHAVYTSHFNYLRHVADVASSRGIPVHTHISETRIENNDCAAKYSMTPTQVYEKAGFFRTPTVAAHCVHLSGGDIEILARHGVSITHCPSSNLKLGSGVAPVLKYAAAGINVALGTDGASSNNNLNMVEEMHIASLAQKGFNEDPLALNAYDTLRMSTVNGAKALSFDDTGVIDEGYKADVVLLRCNGAHAIPLNDPYAAVVYCMQAADVHTVICDGRVLVDGGRLTTIDLEKAAYESRRAADEILIK